MDSNVDTTQVELLTKEICSHFIGTQIGHCARVDFLHRREAMAICQYMAQNYQKDGIDAYVLTAQPAEEQENDVYITTDKAIERRNRKQHRLCLFVPSDLVDSAYSSLSNAFALIDGRKVHESALRLFISQMSQKGTVHCSHHVYLSSRYPYDK